MHGTGLNEDLATPSLAALAHDSLVTLVFFLFRLESPSGFLKWPLSLRVACFGSSAFSALIYGVVPMAEVIHMVVAAIFTILAPALSVEVPACVLP